MRISVVAAAAVLLAACSDGGPNVISIDQTGHVRGTAYIDRDGDGRFGGPDIPAVGVATALVREGTSDTVSRASTRGDGSFDMPRVPIGRYQLVAQRGALGDSVEVMRIDTSRVELAAGDTVRRLIRLAFPTITAAALRLQPAGRRVVVEGIALNAWTTFGDSSVHITDGTGSLRVVRVQASALQAGDSVRLVGVTGVSSGRAVLADATAQILAAARGMPAAPAMSTAAAAHAANGAAADGQARISRALILDTLTVGIYRRVGADDGTGRLEVMLNRTVPFAPEAYQPGASLDLTGVLVPSVSGTTWQLRPRTASEVAASFPTVTAQQARTLPLGARVYIHGIALNGWSTFGDSTVHLADATGAVRLIRVPPSTVGAGDSIRVLGTTGLREGRLVLADAVVQVMAFARGLPQLDSVGTVIAATAANGAKADHHVRIAGAVISDTATVAGDAIVGLDDGSGRLEVVLDRNVAFNPGPYVPGGTFNGAGVLVPGTTPGGWRLKPRDRTEAAISFPTVSLAVARGLPAGRRIVVEGIALNAWATFGDSTVHVMDATATMRAVRVVGPVAAGDSIRVIGTVGSRNGQPVLTAANATVLLRGVGVPAPDSISAARAATADQGKRDAGQVRVAGTVVGQQASNNDQVFTIDDGSGRVEVLFDGDAGISSGPAQPGALLSVAGVLVPTGSGTWQLKPRSSADAVATFPAVTIAQARALPAGKTVFITGIALNAWSTFGDGTLNVSSHTGVAIHVRGLAGAAVFSGDSIRVLGTTAVRNGQPILTGSSASVLLAGVTVPQPVQMTTGAAATAANGTRDASLARISNAVISAVDTVGNDLVLTVSDGSGVLKVVLDGDVGFAKGLYIKDKSIDAVGILLPNANGTAWELKPRSPADATIVN